MLETAQVSRHAGDGARHRYSGEYGSVPSLL